MSKLVGGFQDIFYSKSNFVPLPMIVKAKGIKMWDDKGNEYIDVSSGPVVSNIGHGNKNVAKAMAKQASQMDFAYSRVARHQPNLDLTKQISNLAGKGYERIALSSGGSEGMEIAIKFLRQYSVATGKTNKRQIITLSPSYHGSTIATLAITGDKELETFVKNFAFKAEFIPAPFQYRIPKNHTKKTYRIQCAEALEEKILELGQENVLCFILEPVGGLATGALTIEEDYANKIRKICNKYNVYLIYDEILCGTGRTGNFLASHAWPDAKADIVVLAKGLGSGYTPLGAVLIPEKLCDHLSSLTGFNYSHTYNANPISCATGIAVLREYEKENLIKKAAVRGQYLKKKLKILSSKHKTFGDLRGSGLLMAIELVSDKNKKSIFPAGFYPTEKIRICGLKNGLIIYSRKTANSVNGDWFIIAPPLTITEKECDELLERLDLTLKDFGKLAEEFMSLESKIDG
tara:strand:+ start:660 stop:2042 length:1383 start_codon:yes stop_codon:yes gene_type:complete